MPRLVAVIDKTRVFMTRTAGKGPPDFRTKTRRTTSAHPAEAEVRCHGSRERLVQAAAVYSGTLGLRLIVGLFKLRSLLRPKLRPKLRKPCFSLQFLQKAKRQGRKCKVQSHCCESKQLKVDKRVRSNDQQNRSLCTQSSTNYTMNARADSVVTKLRLNYEIP